jgi:hypothetical protein
LSLSTLFVIGTNLAKKTVYYFNLNNMRFFHLLGFRLFLGIAVIVLAGTTLFTMLLVDWQSSKYIASAKQSATNISDLISRSTRYSMLLNRREEMSRG